AGSGRGREEQDSGAGPNQAGPSVASRPACTANPRLPTPRDVDLIRCAERARRYRDRGMPIPAPASGVPTVSRPDRRVGGGGSGSPSGFGQLRNPQTPGSEEVVGSATALSRPFHTHQLFLAQSDRTLVRRNHTEPNPTRNLPQRSRPDQNHPRLHPALQQEPATL